MHAKIPYCIHDHKILWLLCFHTTNHQSMFRSSERPCFSRQSLSGCLVCTRVQLTASTQGLKEPHEMGKRTRINFSLSELYSGMNFSIVFFTLLLTISQNMKWVCLLINRIFEFSNFCHWFSLHIVHHSEHQYYQ